MLIHASPFLLTSLLAFFPGTVAGVADEVLPDAQVEDAVEDELFYDHAVAASRVDASVSEGIVTLSGTATNALERDRAASIAETVKGVRSVVNRIDVAPTESYTDEDLQRGVRDALFTNPATDSYEVEATVTGGTVTLTGSVDSWREKRLCGTVVKGVDGVTGVDNRIAITYPDERSDAEILHDVEQAIRWDTLVDHGLIDVEVVDDEVKLSGIVGSAAEKRRAYFDAWTNGVASVDDSALEVARWARDEDLRKDKYVVESEAEVEKAIEDALMRDPRVSSFDVTVHVRGTTATLRGTLDNLDAKRAANEIAQHTVGVSAVVDRMRIEPAVTHTDDKVEAAIRSAMQRDAYLERFEITVDVRNGVAHLYGTVDSAFEKARADDVAGKVDGVFEVKNHLQTDDVDFYAYDPYVDDWDVADYDWYDYDPVYTVDTDAEIESEVHDELWWSPFVDADDVEITVEDGVVTLTGTVDSWDERRAATDNAYEGGATWVRNRLAVQ